MFLHPNRLLGKEKPQDDGETVIMQALVLCAEVGKILKQSMLMAESEIKQPRGHSSGKVQSPKFGCHPSDPLSSETQLPDFPNLPAKVESLGYFTGEFAVEEMNNKHDAFSLKRFFKYSLNNRRIIVARVANSYLYYLLTVINI